MRTVLLLLVLCARAHANPAAEKQFQDGKALLAEGKTAEACEAFRRSQDLEARVGTLLNLGDCEEKRGRIATAWVAFVDARALAARLGDARATIADQRAAALAPRLAYLTVKLPEGRPAGLTVRRNESEMPAAELGIEIPLDPGHYELQVGAPGFIAWKHSLDLAVAQHATVDVPALVVDPNAPAASAVVVKQPARAITSHRLGVGAAFGASTDPELFFGLRVPLHLLPLGNGTLRAVPSVFYEQLTFDDNDIYHKGYIVAAGLAVEYVAELAPRFVLAGGLGVGLNFVGDNFAGNSRDPWGAARVSPTLRLGRSVDVGLHLQVVASPDRVIGLGSVGVDYFFY